MDVQLQYFDDCPNWRVADERLMTIATERGDIAVSYLHVETQVEAERVGFHGSPSILIDGVDAFASAGYAVGLACRVYATPDGLAGSPTLEQLRQAINASGALGT